MWFAHLATPVVWQAAAHLSVPDADHPAQHGKTGYEDVVSRQRCASEEGLTFIVSMPCLFAGTTTWRAPRPSGDMSVSGKRRQLLFASDMEGVQFGMVRATGLRQLARAAFGWGVCLPIYAEQSQPSTSM